MCGADYLYCICWCALYRMVYYLFWVTALNSEREVSEDIG